MAGNEITGNLSGTLAQVGTVQGGVHLHAASPPSHLPVPAQLLLPSRHFVGRETELERLSQLSDTVLRTGSFALVVINGLGGVGKSSLALTWLHQVKNKFPDGQLYADLRGGSVTEPVIPSEPLGHFLRALGTPPELVPTDLHEQAALFRSRTASRRFIVLLDDAATAAQVRALLPGDGPVLVVVTSRRRLTGLAVDGASFLSLEPLDRPDAIRLLDRMLGGARTGAEPEAVQSLADLCGRLPLALCTAAARLAARDRWPISRVVTELSEEHGRLAALSEEDVSVRSVFDLTYRDLPLDAARLYRLLSVHPGSDFDLQDAVAVTATSKEQAERNLETMVDANLVQEARTARYRFHDLAKLHTRAVATEEEPEQERLQAFQRLLDSRLGIAIAADRVVFPGRWRLGPCYADTPTASFTDTTEALNWLESELPTLADLIETAHEVGLNDGAWQLCEALWGVCMIRKPYAVWLRTHGVAVRAAAASGDLRAEAHMLEALAVANINLRDFREAADLASRALQLERRAGHLRGEASALNCLGNAWRALGNITGAMELFQQAVDLQRRIGNERGVATVNRRVGETLLQLGRSEEAVAHLVESLSYFEDHDEDYPRSRVLLVLADALGAAGRLDEAARRLDAAVDVADRSGALHTAGDAHWARARLARRVGDHDSERGHLERAMAAYEPLGAPETAEVRARLAELEPPD